MEDHYARLNPTDILNDLSLGLDTLRGKHKDITDISRIEKQSINGLLFREGVIKLFEDISNSETYEYFFSQFLYDTANKRITSEQNKNTINALEYLYKDSEFSYTRFTEIFAGILSYKSVDCAIDAETNARIPHLKQIVFRGYGFNDYLWEHNSKDEKRAKMLPRFNAASLGLRVVGGGLLSARENGATKEEFNKLAASIYDIALPLASQSIMRFTPEHVLLMNATHGPELRKGIDNLANIDKIPNWQQLKQIVSDFEAVTNSFLSIGSNNPVELPNHLSHISFDMTSNLSSEQIDFVRSKIDEAKKQLKFWGGNSKAAWKTILEVALEDYNLLEPNNIVFFKRFPDILQEVLTLNKPIAGSDLYQKIYEVGRISRMAMTNGQIILNPNFVEIKDSVFKLKKGKYHKNGREITAPKILTQTKHHSLPSYAHVGNTDTQSHTGCMGLASIDSEIMGDNYGLLVDELEKFYGEKISPAKVNAVSISNMLMWKIASKLDHKISSKFQP